MENNAFNIYPGDNIPPKINALHNIFGNTYGNFFNANEIMENGEYTRTYNSQYLPADLTVLFVMNFIMKMKKCRFTVQIVQLLWIWNM